MTSLQEDFDVLSQLFQSSDDAVVVCNAEEEIILFNAAASHLYGQVRSVRLADCPQMFGMRSSDSKRLLLKEELPMFRALQGEEVRGFDLVLSDRQHGTRHMVVDAYPVKRDGLVVGAIIRSRPAGSVS